MRSLGYVYLGIQKFNTLIPKPMTAKDYNKTRSKMTDVIKSAVEETINDSKKRKLMKKTKFMKTHHQQMMILFILVCRRMVHGNTTNLPVLIKPLLQF